jgi:hypothetical protein
LTGPQVQPKRIQKVSFGPFGKGAISSANALLALTGSLKSAKNLAVQGVNQVLVRRGSAPVMAFKDDAGTPAAVTSIRAIQPFKDRALVIAHSTATNKVYYYIVKSDFSGWYASNDTLTSTTTATPTGVLWTSITTAPDVSVAEGLGMAFVAHSSAADSAGLNWPTYRIVFASAAWGAQTLQSDLNADASAETLYFSGVISFQQTLWGWGFGSGTSASGTLPTTAPAYDPSKLRFSGIIFTNSDGTTLRDFFSASDSLTEGDRVQSEREKIIAGAVAGNAGLFFGRNNVTRVTGYGRDSWVKEVVDRSYGLVGPKAVASDGTTAYYWSNRGPMQIGASGPPDFLMDPIIEAAVAAINGGLPASIVAGFARDLDQVQWFYQSDATTGLVKFAAFDTRRQIWLGPDSSIGVQVACAGSVEPVYTTASPPGPPAGDPTLTAASAIGAAQFTINWSMGDNTAATEVYYKAHADSTWVLAATVQPANFSIIGLQSNTYTLTGLVASTGYDAQVRHVKNGSFSNYSTSTTPYASTSNLVCTAPTGCTFNSFGAPDTPTAATGVVGWTNTQATASTEVYIAGPAASLPADNLFGKFYTAAPGASSYTVGPVPTTGKYWAHVRHTQTNYDASTMSNTASANLVHFTGIH